MSDIASALARIQQELKAPKGQYNDFAKFNYRSCEDIVEAVKPLLNGCSIVLTDEMVAVGDRIYVRSVARLSLDKEFVTAEGWAREALTKKGMDDAQITGSASSYARKYALNGLFAIDDTKDADSMDNRKQEQPKPAPTKLSPDLVAWIKGERDKGLAMTDVYGKIGDRATMALVQEAWNK